MAPCTDANGVGNTVVNNLDFIIILNNWLQSVPPAPMRANIGDGNTVVNNLDLIPILNFWLQGCT